MVEHEYNYSLHLVEELIIYTLLQLPHSQTSNCTTKIFSYSKDFVTEQV